MKKSIDNMIFKIGVFLIPFENFFFAPSRGWATIAPILFFIYMLLNIKKVKLYNFLLFFFVGIITSIVNYYIVGFNVSCSLNSLIVLTLGISSFYSFSIYYEKTKDLNTIAKILCFSYGIAIIVGIFQFIAIKYNISFIAHLYDIVSKRNYMYGRRVQFTFTEPSFIGMHAYGVLLPIYLITKNKNLLYELIILVLLSLVFGSGLRILLDTMVVICIYLIDKFKNSKKVIMIFILAIPIIFISGKFTYNYLYDNNARFRNIINNGSNGDASAASRWFRIDASMNGYKNNLPHFIFGYGMGNSTLAIRDGYYDALLNYTNSFTSEVRRLEYSYDDNASYSMYIRLISEYGIIWTLLLLLFIGKLFINSKFKHRLLLLLVTAYLYVQFDSLGFYSLWLCILILYYTSKQFTYPKNKLNNV